MRPEVTAVILTEAGPEIGHGHLGRCVALADGLDRYGVRVTLAVRGETPVALSHAHEVLAVEWLDAADHDELLAGADIAVVDSYEAPLDVYESVAESVGTPIWFDDDVRLDYPAGLIVNGSPVTLASDYPGSSQHELLLGPECQSLRPAFWEVAERSVNADLTRALVVFGGTDVRNLGPTVAERMRRAYPDVEFDVVGTSRSAEEMRDAMLAADVAITAAGQTLYELACTGTPAVAIWVAENQEPQARAFEQTGAVVLAGRWSEPHIGDALVERLGELTPRPIRQRMATAGQALVDGQGASRVARAAVSHALDRRIELRRACAEDEAALLELANDSEIRDASFSSARITNEQHHEWFSARLQDPNTLLLPACDGSVLAGYVRFQVANEHAEVSIALAAGYRGLGLGSHLLGRGLAVLHDERPAVREVVARVRPENDVSRRLFEASGFLAVQGLSIPGQQLVLMRYL